MRYVALGDSFTEGVGDQPERGTVRGWADFVASGLAQASAEPVYYANLAVRGRLLEPIVTDQLPAAMQLDPAATLMSFNGGGNDILRPGYDKDHMVSLVQRVIDETARSGATLVLLSGPDPSDRLPGGRRMRRLGQELTDAMIERAAAFDHVVFVDNFHDLETRRAPYWSADRLHLNTLGHQRVAARVLCALGYDVPVPVAPQGPDPRRTAAREMAYWATYVAPWIARRVTRRSSGDGRSAKVATWTRI